MIVFVDSGVLGILSSPNDKLEVQQCQQWLYGLLAKGVYVISSVLCDYELRISFVLNNIKLQTLKSQASINNLEQLQELIDFLSITKPVILKASQLWAESKIKGIPSASMESIDVYIIIASQCQLIQAEYPGQNVIMATTNVKHLSRFVQANEWYNIKL